MNNIKVLLVDDEAEFLDPMIKRLTLRKFTVYSAPGGEEALGLIQEKDVDVVLLDVRMPGLNGMDTLREIRKMKPDVQVIMLTGHANIEVAVEGMNEGAFDYLLKPVDMEELVYKIQDAYQEGMILGNKTDKNNADGSRN